MASAVARLRRRRKENSVKETIVAVTGPIQFDKPTTIKEVSVSLKMPNTRHVELSYLRSAYLLVFSLLGRSGYEYAQSEAVRPIRKQIMNPDDECGPSLVRAFPSEKPLGNMTTLRNNERPFFWSVRFDDGACVFLPYGGSENHYRQVAELPENKPSTDGSGSRGSLGAPTLIDVVYFDNLKQARMACLEESM